MIPEKGANELDSVEYGRTLQKGLGINLLVQNMEVSIQFQHDILKSTILYWDDMFAVVQNGGSEWMLHQDITYRSNPLSGILKGTDTRGAGVQMHIYGLDPDEAVKRAEAGDYHVLSAALDKPHGQREAVILDPDGYAWVAGKTI